MFGGWEALGGGYYVKWGGARSCVSRTGEWPLSRRGKEASGHAGTGSRGSQVRSRTIVGEPAARETHGFLKCVSSRRGVCP